MITDELVDRALAVVAESGANYEYFFAKLTSPDWIVPLQKKRPVLASSSSNIGRNLSSFSAAGPKENIWHEWRRQLPRRCSEQ